MKVKIPKGSALAQNVGKKEHPTEPWNQKQNMSKNGGEKA